MDLKLLQSFCAFAESANLVEAAARLGLSQPALSAHLQALEAMLPQSPFEQQGRRKVLTRYGNDLYEAVKNRLTGIDQLIESVNKRHLSAGEFRVRVCGSKEIMARIAEVTFELPQKLEFIACANNEAMLLLENDTADVAVTSEIPDSLNFIAKLLFKDSFKLVYPKRWSLSADRLSKGLVEELSTKPFLSYGRQSPLIVEFAQRYGLTVLPEPQRIVTDWPALIKLTEAAAGWTLAPSSYLRHESKTQIVDLPSDLAVENKFYMVFSKSDSQLPWFKTLCGQIAARF